MLLSGIVFFGILEVDLRVGELHKSRKGLKLRDQPFGCSTLYY